MFEEPKGYFKMRTMRIWIFTFFIYLFIFNANTQASPAQYSGGLHGYISATISPAPEEYGYGVSFYSRVWPLLRKPIKDFQVGLPATWLTPNNNDFTQYLCPLGSYPREHWMKTRSHFFFRSVFQTIEGGFGFWNNTQFASVVPKYRLNGTPDCYTNQISSPGWGFGTPKSLSPRLMGIAQLSNRILIPPDGLTFPEKLNGEVIGSAWMALPFPIDSKSSVPTGNQSWTFFINARNFAGPVAFYIPNNWSKLSENYKVVVKRGLDTRPAIMKSSAMEVNSVPYFEVENEGVIYSKIPDIQFPVDKNGHTILMHDIYFYSKEAMFFPIEKAIRENENIPTSFIHSSQAAFVPTCKSNPLQFTQGPKEDQIRGMDSIVHAYTTTLNGKCLFGLQWTHAREGWALFPAYFKKVGNNRQVIERVQIPEDVSIKNLEFIPAAPGETYYVSPEEKNIWQHWATEKLLKVKLSDHSIVFYRWYRFVDQPSLQSLNLTSKQKNILQSFIIKLHKKWQGNLSFMPASSRGALADVDTGILVTPPKGLEYGYVPIVVKQSH